MVIVMRKIVVICLLFLTSCTSQDAVTVSKQVSWGIGKEKTEAGQPLDCVKANEEFKDYNTIFVGNSNEKKIYLTFDNGYENGNTEIILDVMKEKDVHAVFFVTSHYAANQDKLIKRMIEEGHIIGNHSYTHKSFSSMSKENVQSDVLKLHSLMIDKYNYVMDLVRPPEGEFSIESLEATSSLNYQCVMWSFAYYDYDVNNQMEEDKALDKLKAGLHPGAIYLLHAVSETNAKVLGDFIDYARSEGYTISDYDLY